MPSFYDSKIEFLRNNGNDIVGYLQVLLFPFPLCMLFLYSFIKSLNNYPIIIICLCGITITTAIIFSVHIIFWVFKSYFRDIPDINLEIAYYEFYFSISFLPLLLTLILFTAGRKGLYYSKKTKIWIALGVVIVGGILAKMLIPRESNADDVTNQKIGEYIISSVEKNIIFDSYEKTYDEYNNIFSSKEIERTRYIFQDKNSKKYYDFESFDDDGLIGGYIDYSLNRQLKVYVNKKELEDSSYGTKEKPIPILSVKLSAEALNVMKQYEIEAFQSYNDLEQPSVEKYLKYFKSKEDFKKMFPENKN